MRFSEAFKLMKQGALIKLPSWAGYWYWSKEKQTIIIHTKDGEEFDIRKQLIQIILFQTLHPMIGLFGI